MNEILIKILAMGLALSQVTTTPDNVKTVFDPQTDQAEVVRLLGEGCSHIKKVFDIEEINLDDLIATAMEDPQAMSGNITALRGMKFDDLIGAYKQYCNHSGGDAKVDVGQLIAFYNSELYDLPDHAKLKEQAMRTMTVVLDDKGGRFADIGEQSRRRSWVPLHDIPVVVRKAFVAAEDKRFYEHGGVDERGMIRALVGNLADPGRPQGGSTITQQVAKNLLVGNGVNFERKLREIVLASRIERSYSKDQILEIYLNSIYFGRGVWGIEMAAKSYFGKPAKDLTIAEGAMLAAMIKGPAYFNPDRYPQRVAGRLNYVLKRMAEDGVITGQQMEQALAKPVKIDEPLRRDRGFAFMDYVVREAEEQGRVRALGEDAYVIRTTIRPELQIAIESALQEGLARFEKQSGRYEFKGPEANLSEAIARIDERRGGKEGSKEETKDDEAQEPAWLLALRQARLPLYDVHWSPAVVVEGAGGKSESLRVGLSNGEMLPLKVPGSSIGRTLQPNDVVLVKVEQSRKGKSPYADLRIRPILQGAAIALDNKTGKILAMTGGFSYPLSQLNRATQSWRQPGSALKPVTYLTALKAGLRPTSIVMDTAITLAPITGSKDYWTPKNYSGKGSGPITIAQALERSRNLATVHLLDGGIAAEPKESLDKVCETAVEANLYGVCEPFYPFVLGAQPLRVIDLAAFYAAIANGGVRPTPYAVEQISKDGRTLYRHSASSTALSGSAASFYELKEMLNGVVQRGTATSIRPLAPYVAGKTGTSNDAADTWFAGFSNDVTVVVWMGYDNADGQRRSLGNGATGNRVAAPVFGQVMEAAWADYAPRAPLTGPSKDVKREIAALDARESRRIVGQASMAPPKTRVVRREEFEPMFFEGRRGQRWRNRGDVEGRGRGGFFGGFFGFHQR
jgi:1A family penicillin-binding protein